jgi:hypothetical protein
MTRRPRTATPLLLAVLGALLISCGSTRYVVVDNAGAGAGAAAAPTTTGAAASKADEEAIRAAVMGALNLDPKNRWESRTKYLTSDASDVEPTYLAVEKLISQVDADLTIDKVTVAGTTATATITVNVGGQPYAADVPVEVVKEGDAWKVTRGGACAALAIGSPCPDA